MAKPKKPNRSSHDQPPAFFEALPASVIAPLAPPQMGEQLTDSARALATWTGGLAARLNKTFWRFRWWLGSLQRRHIVAALNRLRALAWNGAQHVAAFAGAAGLATTNGLIFTGRVAGRLSQYAGLGTARYTPAIAADLRHYSRRLARELAGRRARVLYISAAATVTVALGALGLKIADSTLHSYASYIASPSALLAKKKTGTTILDRNGQVLYEGFGGQVAHTIPLNDLPQNLKNATLAAEDPGFYDHAGFSWRGTARAAWVDLTHGSAAEGGSTLTQQLVKNALLTSNKNFQRKFQELLLSVDLEKHYSKDEILDMYLNEVYYGEGSSGIEAASETYFHKPAHDLSLSESALLAGLPLGPSRFDPNLDMSAATGRRDYVLGRMVDLGKITKAQAAAAKAQPLTVYARNVQIQAPWFVFYVLDQLRSTYGDDLVEQGGITVKTTLDITKENQAEQDIQSHINALANHHVTNGALISIEPSTGDIIAMVGSTDYNAPGFGNVNVTLSDLQPGSSFKPIAYATAFKKGWTGASTVDDTPLSVPNGDGTFYTPQNYDLKFHGTVTLRHALDNSLNIPAVKVLQFAGIPDTLQTAHDLGITTLSNPSSYGLSLVLGGGEVRPIDMATVYATFANGGTKIEPRAILSVTDRYGKDITKHTQPAPKPVLDPRVAYMITNILSDDPSRQPEFPANGPLTLPGRPVAAKTGTTNDFRDNWTVGYTPQLATAVWVGNNDHTAMENVDGITGAAPIWHDFMAASLDGQPVQNFTIPDGVTIIRTCMSAEEVFMTDRPPNIPCVTAPTPTPQPDDHPGDNPGHGHDFVPIIVTPPPLPPIKFPGFGNN